ASVPSAGLRPGRWPPSAAASLGIPVPRVASRLAMMVPIETDRAPLADYFGVPIVPPTIDGPRRAMPPGSDPPRPRNVTIVYGPRLDAAELARTGRGDDNAERIINNLHDCILDMRRDVHG